MLKRYDFFNLLYLAYCKIRTFILTPKARLIRFPIDIRNISQIDFGTGLTTGIGCRLEVETINGLHSNIKRLIFGCNIQINDYVHITAGESVIIKDNVLIASKVYISDCSHGSYGKGEIHNDPRSVPKERKIFTSPVSIDENVWIGENVAILMGVTIGEGSIIGANSVVSKSIPPFCIAVGIPAKPIKKFDFENMKWEKIIDSDE